MLLKIVYYYRARDWPPIALLLIGLPPRQPRHVRAVPRFLQGRRRLVVAAAPSTLMNQKFLKAIPHDAFCQLSASQLWALRMTRVGYLDMCRAEGGTELM